MASLRADGRWVASRLVGKKRLWFYGSTEAEAEALKRGEAPRCTTFEDFAASVWIPKTRSCAPTTKRKYNGLMSRYILPALGHLPLDAIDARDVQAVIEGMKPQPRNRWECLMLMRGIFNLAVRHQRLARSPAALATTPRPVRRRTRRGLNPERAAQVLALARGTWLEPAVFLACVLGLRRGEICGLKWSHVHEDRVELVEQRQPREKAARGLKSHPEGRDIPIPGEVARWFEKLERKGPYVVVDPRGRPAHPDTLSKEVPRVCGLGLHEMRALAATNLAMLGVDPFTVMAILGHTKLDMTLVYAHSQDAQKREGIRRLVSAFVVENVVKPG